MSLEFAITAAVSASDAGLTRDELLAKVRAYDSEQNIMRMVGRMLAGNRLQYSSAGRYSLPPLKPAEASPAATTATASTTRRRKPADVDQLADFEEAHRVTQAVTTMLDAGQREGKQASVAADGRRIKTRDRIMEFIGTEARTTREIMDGCELAENCVGHHLRALMVEGVLQKTPITAKGKARRYHRPGVQSTQEDAPSPSHRLHPAIERLKAAGSNAQKAIEQFSAALAEFQQHADALPASDS